MLLGQIIYDYRRSHRLSQRQFAEKCGDLSHGYIWMVENNTNPNTKKPLTPSVDKVASLARGLGISTQELYRMADDLAPDLFSDPLTSNDIVANASSNQLTADEEKFLSNAAVVPAAKQVIQPSAHSSAATAPMDRPRPVLATPLLAYSCSAILFPPRFYSRLRTPQIYILIKHPPPCAFHQKQKITRSIPLRVCRFA